MLAVAPLTVKQAQAVCKRLHRHFPDVQGGLFACAAINARSGWVHGVAIAANPAQVWQGTGRAVISRVATDGAMNGCTILLGALCRALKAIGYREAWTYTLPHEGGGKPPGRWLRAGRAHRGRRVGSRRQAASRSGQRRSEMALVSGAQQQAVGGAGHGA